MNNDISSIVERLAAEARQAARTLIRVDRAAVDNALLIAAQALDRKRDMLKTENAKDLEGARSKGLSAAMIDRLTLSDKALGSMIEGLRVVAKLDTPVGNIYDERIRPNGLRIYKRKVPIGVVAIIYESRPNVTVDAAAICLKSQNAVILRGGSESFHSNLALARLFADALNEAGLPSAAVQLVPTTDRQAVDTLLTMDRFIDLVIPRGGESLIRAVVEKSRIPVIKHYKGVCSIFVDDKANVDLARRVCLNAKVQKPATCNALETLLVHRDVAPVFLPPMVDLFREHGVTVKGCRRVVELIPDVEEASEQAWYEEYLDLVVNIRIVDDMDQAIEHISTFGSEHTDAIITQDYSRAWRFVREVNSSLVLVNASTRLNDGFQLGLGAEMGISTTKLHAFGPMGLEELTVNKFIAFGEGQVRG